MITKENLRIVFMGTPDFAVESLKILVENKYNVVGVITVPDKPAGRGRKIHESAVKKYASQVGLPILQPTKLKDPEFLKDLEAWKADLQIVVAFRMLPVVVWDMPSMGTFNLHGSLLPQYRGAAPINWAVINGDQETGVTTFFLQHEIDTGNIILQKKIAIGENDNVGTVHDKLMAIGAELVKTTVEKIIAQDIEATPQEDLFQHPEQLNHAPKIFKEDCKINWEAPIDHIHNLIRGLSPYPAAWTELEAADGKKLSLKIFESLKEKNQHNLQPGSIITDGKKTFKIAIKEGFISIQNLQLAGKKRMATADFLRGFSLTEDFKVL